MKIFNLMPVVMLARSGDCKQPIFFEILRSLFAKIFNSIAPADCPDNLFFNEIPDLDAAAIAGGASASVDAVALAFGPTTYAFTDAKTRSTAYNPKVSVATGSGFAIAMGNQTFTNVSVSGTGDKVFQQSKTYDFNNTKISTGYVIAIDYQ
jgi:hypothetical protein